jgi:ABC-type uncharacterized transport system substrate-binding protein
MRRRDFFTLLGGAAASWPRAAHAQQPMPVIGYLSNGTRDSDVVYLAAFRQGLGETGYVEGLNVTFEFRWAEHRYERLPAMAAELVHRPVNVIAAIGGTPPALAAKAATSTIPVVFSIGVDPVQFGLVSSLHRPGGNMTGIAALQTELAAKRIQLLHELVPKASLVALLVNPTNPFTEPETRAADEAARSLGLNLHVLTASTASDIDAAFGKLAELRPGALLINGDVFLLSRREQLAALAAQHMLPAIYGWREYGTAGGLICYAPSLADGYRQLGSDSKRCQSG